MKKISLSFIAITSNFLFLNAFSVPRTSSWLNLNRKNLSPTTLSATLTNNHHDVDSATDKSMTNIKRGISTLALTAAIAVSPLVANADDEFTSSSYDTSSPPQTTTTSTTYQSDDDTVELVIQNLKAATGDASKSFKTFETVNEIITEGKGVGGSLSYAGVKLDRGFVADEDTTVYNPGLSLLTESEKASLVDALLQNRKGNIASNTWTKDNQYAFDALKMRLDPLHMVELEGYLKVLPFLGGAVYLLALAVQQFARGIFEAAYVVSALVVFIPIFVLIAVGV